MCIIKYRLDSDAIKSFIRHLAKALHVSAGKVAKLKNHIPGIRLRAPVPINIFSASHLSF